MTTCAIACDNEATEHTHTCPWHHNRATLWFANHDRPGSILWIRDWLNTNRGQHITSSRLDSDHIHSTPDSPTPLHLDIHDLLQNLTDLVWGWERALRHEFNRPEPDERFTLEAGVQFLRSWWPKLEEREDLRPVLADAWHEFNDLTQQCHGHAPWRQGVRRIGGVPCPYCQQATLAVYDGNDTVTCTSCGGSIHRDVYTQHVTDTTQRQQAAQTIADMAKWIGVPAKTLHDWKRLGLIRPVTDPTLRRDRLYRVSDVEAVIAERRAS